MIKSPWLYHLKNRAIKNRSLKKFLKKSRLFNVAYEHLLTAKPPLLEADERKVIRDILFEDVQRLEKISGKVPCAWKDFMQG